MLHPPEFLAEWLRVLDPRRATEIAAADPYRVARALEIALTARSGAQNDDALAPLPSLRARGIPFVKYYLDIDAAVLEERIHARTDAMLAAGFVEEAERVGAAAVAADAVGYREALAYLAGWSIREELRAHLIRNTRRYAKRQATWFRREPGLVRLAPSREGWMAAARELWGWA
jgi:tRNA dimethylallyltransferase